MRRSPQKHHHSHHHHSHSHSHSPSSSRNKSDRTHGVLKSKSSEHDSAIAKAAESFETMWRERVAGDAIISRITNQRQRIQQQQQQKSQQEEQAESSSTLDATTSSSASPSRKSPPSAAAAASTTPPSSQQQKESETTIDQSAISLLYDHVSRIPQHYLSSSDRTRIVNQFQDLSLVIPKDLTRIRIGLSTALRTSVGISDENLYDLLVQGKIGANLLRVSHHLQKQESSSSNENQQDINNHNVTHDTNQSSSSSSSNQKEVSLHSILDVALWIKYQFVVYSSTEDASREDSPSRDQLDCQFNEIADSVALFEAASIAHVGKRQQQIQQQQQQQNLLGNTNTSRNFNFGNRNLFGTNQSNISPTTTTTTGTITGTTSGVRLTPRVALAAMQCEPPMQTKKSKHHHTNKSSSPNRRRSSAARKRDDSDSSSSSSSSCGGGGSGSDSDDDKNNNSGSDQEGKRKHGSNKRFDDDDDDEDTSSETSSSHHHQEKRKKRSSSSSKNKSDSHQHHHHHHKSPEAEARKELRSLFATDPWRQSAAALFASLGGDVFTPKSSLPFSIVERVVRLTLHRRVEAAAVEGAINALSSRHEGKRMSLVELEYDVVRPLARLLGCDTTSSRSTQSNQAEDGVSSQIRAAQRVIKLFMTPASKLQRDEARGKAKKNFANTEDLLDAANYQFEKVSRRLQELAVIEPHLSSIFKNRCTLQGTGLQHVLDLSRFSLQDFVQKVKDNRPIAVNPADALRLKIVDRFVNCVERAARTLFEHSANCARCKDIAEHIRNAVNEARQRESEVQRQADQTLRSRHTIAGVSIATALATAAARKKKAEDEEEEQQQQEGGFSPKRTTSFRQGGGGGISTRTSVTASPSTRRQSRFARFAGRVTTSSQQQQKKHEEDESGSETGEGSLSSSVNAENAPLLLEHFQNAIITTSSNSIDNNDDKVAGSSSVSPSTESNSSLSNSASSLNLQKHQKQKHHHHHSRKRSNSRSSRRKEDHDDAQQEEDQEEGEHHSHDDHDNKNSKNWPSAAALFEQDSSHKISTSATLRSKRKDLKSVGFHDDNNTNYNDISPRTKTKNQKERKQEEEEDFLSLSGNNFLQQQQRPRSASEIRKEDSKKETSEHFKKMKKLCDATGHKKLSQANVHSNEAIFDNISKQQQQQKRKTFFTPVPPTSIIPCATNIIRSPKSSSLGKTKNQKKIKENEHHHEHDHHETEKQKLSQRQRSGQLREIHRILAIRSAFEEKSRSRKEEEEQQPLAFHI